METITFTTSSPPRGWSFQPGSDPIVLSPGGSDMQVVATVAAGSSAEWRPVDSSGALIGSWTPVGAGQAFTLHGGDRVAVRGTGGLTFACSGSSFDELAKFTGARGSQITWG